MPYLLDRIHLLANNKSSEPCKQSPYLASFHLFVLYQRGVLLQADQLCYVALLPLVAEEGMVVV